MPKLADEINLKFVQLYREEECLWNASIPSYKDKQMRDSSLEKIRDILNKDGIEMSIKEIKNKIKNLRATYCQELTKIEKSERSGAGTAEVYKPKIIWFEEMHNFIKKVPMKRKTSNNQDSPNNNKDDNSASNSQSLEPPVAENLSEKTVEMSQPASEMSSIQDKTSKFISPGSWIPAITQQETNISSVSESLSTGPSTSFTGIKKGVKSLKDKKICSLRSEISRLRKKGTNLKAKLNNAEKLSKNPLFYKFTKDMTRPARLFTQMQVFQTSKKPKGRRYTTDEKILCLSMYKKSPKCYGVLYKFFTLSSAKAMKRLLAKIKIKSSINTILFEQIKKTVADKDISDRLCSLIFDEMAITPQIHYNTQKDVLQGFDEEGKKFANHVLVFMIKGIKENFKQPIAYYFTNCLNTYELKKK
ncbi:unnamed protein product [Euphydryas editha]|uniref:MADF domain-containing protein n=1 Tax=Euphydryas editha TaxID=104508 RepID=A0AAU9TQP9_EUPED|nr:unnamed protein product [Euphydryas editha]